jgi:hypothetical protein
LDAREHRLGYGRGNSDLAVEEVRDT